MKVSKALRPGGGSKSGISRIDPASYHNLQEVELGTHTFDAIELCAMGGAEDADGFYHVVSRVSL